MFLYNKPTNAAPQCLHKNNWSQTSYKGFTYGRPGALSKKIALETVPSVLTTIIGPVIYHTSYIIGERHGGSRARGLKPGARAASRTGRWQEEGALQLPLPCASSVRVRAPS